MSAWQELKLFFATLTVSLSFWPLQAPEQVFFNHLFILQHFQSPFKETLLLKTTKDLQNVQEVVGGAGTVWTGDWGLIPHLGKHNLLHK